MKTTFPAVSFVLMVLTIPALACSDAPAAARAEHADDAAGSSSVEPAATPFPSAEEGPRLFDSFDPDVWFGSVEHIAARRIGRETVQYVSNIAKYYVAYKLAERQRERKELLLEELS